MAIELNHAVVTGANRGLGLETVRQLAARGIHTVLCARDPEKGARAAQALRQQSLPVEFFRVEMTDAASMDALCAHVLDRFGRLDILVNNAGVLWDDPAVPTLRVDLDLIRRTLEVNSLGPLRLCQKLVPLMQGRGRIVNVSSGMGQLTGMNGGYAGYRVSKSVLNAVTRMLADELKDTQIKINSVCPGWVRTDMGGPNADRSVSEGVKTAVWLATLPEDGPSGGFFRDQKPIEW